MSSSDSDENEGRNSPAGGAIFVQHPLRLSERSASSHSAPSLANQGDLEGPAYVDLRGGLRQSYHCNISTESFFCVEETFNKQQKQV